MDSFNTEKSDKMVKVISIESLMAIIGHDELTDGIRFHYFNDGPMIGEAISAKDRNDSTFFEFNQEFFRYRSSTPTRKYIDYKLKRKESFSAYFSVVVINQICDPKRGDRGMIIQPHKLIGGVDSLEIYPMAPVESSYLAHDPLHVQQGTKVPNLSPNR